MSYFNDHKYNHEENRLKVCFPCGRKIILGKQKLNFYRINEKIESNIKEILNNDFSCGNSKYPLSICNTCRAALLSIKNGIKRNRPKMPNYNDINLKKKQEVIMMNVIAIFVLLLHMWVIKKLLKEQVKYAKIL